jgi:hypothetical protein
VLKIKLNLSSENASVGEIKNKVKEEIHRHMSEEGVQVDLETMTMPIIIVAKERRLIKMAVSNMLLSELDKAYHLCAVEREVFEN